MYGLYQLTSQICGEDAIDRDTTYYFPVVVIGLRPDAGNTRVMLGRKSKEMILQIHVQFSAFCESFKGGFMMLVNCN